jgi:hypothetical protein
MIRAPLFLLLLALVLAGCGDDDVPAGDAGPGRDSGGVRRDSGGEELDSGGEELDSGPVPDAGPPACAPPPAFDVGATYTTELHVDPSGDDGAAGTAAAPLATLRAATARATPGTRIVVHAGTYTGSPYIENLQGTAAAPIAIVAEGAAIFDAAGAGEVMHVTDAQYLVIEGLTLQGSMINGLNMDDGGTIDTPAHHIVLRNLTLRDIGSGGNNDCIKLSGLDDYWILDSDITSCSAGDAIDHVGCHSGVIHGNFIHDTTGSGGIQAKGGSHDIVIHGNRFVDVNARAINAGGSTGLEFFRPIDAPYEARNIRVVANVFIRPGENSGAPIAFVGCDACVFANNTVIEPRTWIARILQETVGARFVPSRNGLYANNLIVFDVSDLRGVLVNVGTNTAPETFTFANNLWWALDDPTFMPTYTDGIPAEVSPVTMMDPMLADIAGGDFHIPAAGPATAAGRDIPGGVPGDFEGNCYGTPPTIGAFEPR